MPEGDNGEPGRRGSLRNRTSSLTLRLRSANGQELQANESGLLRDRRTAGEYRAWLEQDRKVIGEPKSVRIVSRKGLFETLDQRP